MDHTSSKKRKMARALEGGAKLAKCNQNETFSYKINSISKNDEDDPSFMPTSVGLGELMPAMADEGAAGEVSPTPCGGERVKTYWKELSARRVFIPERWNQEGLLMDWVDYSSFDSLLAPKGIDSARKALIAQAQRPQQQEKKVLS